MTAPNLEQLTAQAARIIRRAADNLDVPNRDWPTVAAAVVLNLPTIAAGHRALTVLDQLAARHQPTRWSDDPDSTVVVCRACNTAWPCPDGALLTSTHAQVFSLPRPGTEALPCPS